MSFFYRIGLLLLFACVATNRAVAAEVVATPETGISEITMQRTACFGACPIDSVTLRADGTASYSGMSSAPRTGRYNGTIAPEKFARLAAWLEEQNFFEFRPEIGRGNIDAPDLIVAVVRDRLPYVVAFRLGGNRALQGKIKNPRCKQRGISMMECNFFVKRDRRRARVAAHVISGIGCLYPALEHSCR